MVGVVEEVGNRCHICQTRRQSNRERRDFLWKMLLFANTDMSIIVPTSTVAGLLGCRIDGGQAEYVRVPYADQGLNRIPDTVSDEQALFVGDILATGFWATRISEITEKDTVLIIGAGPTGNLYFTLLDAEEPEAYHCL